jgi:hypothetical protein
MATKKPKELIKRKAGSSTPKRSLKAKYRLGYMGVKVKQMG